MRIIVNDSSALIDLKKGELLEVFLELPFDFIISDEMLSDELLSFTKKETALMRKKMKVATLSSQEEVIVISLQRETPALTLYDCAALVISKREAGCILLTGDKRLREKAVRAGVECHGVLWIVEELTKAKLGTRKTLLKALEIWRDDPFVRLPKEEVIAMVMHFQKIDR